MTVSPLDVTHGRDLLTKPLDPRQVRSDQSSALRTCCVAHPVGVSRAQRSEVTVHVSVEPEVAGPIGVRVMTCQPLDAILALMNGSDEAPISPDSLARERCAEIRAGTPPLTTDAAGSLAAGVADEWRIEPSEIRREFTFKTFNAAFGLATRIALLAEAQGHHPEMEVGWGRLVVRLSTHSVGGLSRNDFIMAARIDRLADS
jgi:4a-hydroxytetrahydrobiopterin dehydratase